jgi:parallel beta-helix repeat protein
MKARTSACLLVLALFVTQATAQQDSELGVIWVANNGLDAPDCGTRTHPCRSISFGIANAREGDTVLVEPGRYGDVNSDFQYVSPGDERADLALGCVICIDKAVTVLSTAGPKVTIIDPASFQPPTRGPRPPELRWTVLISAPGVRLGGSGQGFTIYGHSRFAVVGQAGDVRVVGNTALNGGIKLFAEQGDLVVARNTVSNTDIGIQVSTASTGSKAVITRNVSEGNSNTGFSMSGPGRYIISRNHAIASKYGFAMGGEGAYTIENNIATANEFGFVALDSGHTFRGNTAAGNDVGFNFSARTGPLRNSFHTNNMLGSTFCGLSQSTGAEVDATNNYWGSPTGPGPKPADKICNFREGHTGAVSTTLFVPFATYRFGNFKIK